MHGPEIVFEQSDSVRISQGRGSLVCKVLHNKRELLKVFVFRSVCRFCVGGAVFTDDSSFSYSYKSYRSTVFWRRASLRTRSDDYFVFITQLIYSRIFSFFETRVDEEYIVKRCWLADQSDYRQSQIFICVSTLPVAQCAHVRCISKWKTINIPPIIVIIKKLPMLWTKWLWADSVLWFLLFSMCHVLSVLSSEQLNK